MSTPEERLREYGDVLLSSLIGSSEEIVERRRTFLGLYSPEMFHNEQFAIYRVLWAFRERSISIDSTFIQVYLTRRRKLLDARKNSLNITAHAEVDDDQVLGYIVGVRDYFVRLQGVKPVDQAEFDLTVVKYLEDYSTLESLRLMEDASRILIDGDGVGKKQGFEDAANHLKVGLADIDGVVNRSAGSGFVSMEAALLGNKTNINKTELVTTFGTIEELNEAYGGVYTGNLYSVMAPPKAGKTKFCARIVYNALMSGKNVSVWPVEGGVEYFIAQLRAIHFDAKANDGITNAQDRVSGVSQKTILEDSFENERIRQMEASFALDLASNASYGSLEFIDRPFTVETFLQDTDTSVKSNGSKLVVYDYLQLIGSENSRLSERERLAMAYPAALQYAKRNNVAIMSPAQYNQEAVKGLSKSSTGAEELRTAGGGSAEIIRSSDYIFALWASTEDLKNRRITFKSIPSRFAQPFEDFTVYADLGVCAFYSER